MIYGQVPFTCEGQVWVVTQEDDALLELSIGSNNGITTEIVKNNLGVQVLAMGFRSTDRFLYGINPVSHELYRIDATGAVVILATPNVDPMLVYQAGDISPDGSRFVVVGSGAEGDVKVSSINLESGNYEVEEYAFDFGTKTFDIAFNPITSQLYGFDAEGRSFYTFELGSTEITRLNPINFEHEVQGFYFDAFGDMYAYGTALFGVISAIYEVEQSSGETRLISSSGLNLITDLASCPYSVELNAKITPEVFFPCSDLMFEYTFANQTGQTVNNLLLEHELAPGYIFEPPVNIPLGGVLDETTPDNLLRIENISLPYGIRTHSFRAYVDDIPQANYRSQAILSNVPEENGASVISNDPASFAIEDSTLMVVNRIDEDSLSFQYVLCHGQSLELDASDYGNNLSWSNGATGQLVNVSDGGLITMTAASGCQELFVSYDVVTASCPFTVELRHLVIPDSIFACSEVVFQYILENDTGEDRFNIILLDTLPEGFTFSEILSNPYESMLSENLDDNIFQLEGILLKTGVDTIEVLVHVDDVPPGIRRNKVLLKGLPQVLGPTRTSDDPRTFNYPDSTSFYVRGVEGGSQQIDTVLCPDESLVLDASIFGESVIWEDGSTESQYIIDEVGLYEVMILDGCDTATVSYYVEEADIIEVVFGTDAFQINQSESIQLNPSIFNQGDSLYVNWVQEMSNSLSCLNCPSPIATPLSDVIYTIHVENEYCRDSAEIEVFVDETRRVHIPSVFSPNGDGVNDYFYFQSPDPATVLTFQVFDRWGRLVFETNDFSLNQESEGWNGMIDGTFSQSGVYVWFAQIKFFDGKEENWSGDITVIK